MFVYSEFSCHFSVQIASVRNNHFRVSLLSAKLETNLRLFTAQLLELFQDVLDCISRVTTNLPFIQMIESWERTHATKPELRMCIRAEMPKV